MRPPRGGYRDYLEVQQKTDVDTDISGTKPVWTTFAYIYAGRKVYQTGTERYGSGRDVAKQVVTWQTNYREDITSKMRLLRGTEEYNVIGTRDVEGARHSMLIDTELIREGFGT